MRLATWLHLAPAVLAVAFLLGFPFVVLLANSVTTSPAGTVSLWPLTLVHVKELVTDVYYYEVLGRTLVLSAIVTVLSAVLAYPLAIGIMNTRSRTVRLIYIVASLTPLMTSVVIRAFGWQVFLGPGGPVANLLVVLLGPQYLRGVLNTPFSLVIGLVHLGLPFMLLMLLPVVVKIDGNVLRAAAVLGASPLQAFRRVLLPLSMPGLIAGSVVTFSICATVVVTPTVLGGREQGVFSMLVYDQILRYFNWNLGGALAVALMLTVVLVAAIVTALGHRHYAAWMSSK
jgi:putative spermidine/putrescine transport system permease protein